MVRIEQLAKAPDGRLSRASSVQQLSEHEDKPPSKRAKRTSLFPVGT